MVNNDCVCKAIKMKVGQTSSVKMKVGQTSSVKFSIGSRCCSTPSYNALPDKPSINNVVLMGNKTSKDIHVQHEMDEITYQDIDNIIFG